MTPLKLVVGVAVAVFFMVDVAFAQSAASPNPDSRECSVTRRQNLDRAVELGCLRDLESAYTFGLLDGVEMAQEHQEASRPSPDQTLAEIEAREAQRRLETVRGCISRAQAYVFNPGLTQMLYSSLARCERLAEGLKF